MAEDQDLASLLPRAPPASPARREAAIEAALRRFDGLPGSQAASDHGAKRPWWYGRPQLGAVVAACLLVVIGLPLALVTKEDRIRAVGPRDQAPAADRTAGEQPPRAIVTAEPAGDRPAANPAVVETGAPETPPPAVAPAPVAAPTVGAEPEAGAAPPPPAPVQADEAEVASRPALAPVEARSTPRARTGAVRGYRIAQEPGDRAAVTRRAASNAPTACTIEDPDRSLERCRDVIDPAAAGRAGRAAARIADGLSQAWQGNLDAARRAFDQAIAADPRSPLAYLNRALVLERQGDLKRAEQDLVRATELAPDSSQARYHLARLRRGASSSGAGQDD